jgi:hypothetical protein
MVLVIKPGMVLTVHDGPNARRGVAALQHALPHAALQLPVR